MNNGAIIDNAIIDNRELQRYEWTVDGVLAHLDYVREAGRIVFTHTIVPKEIGGRGIGAVLAAHALDAARAQGEAVVAQCSFIAGYIGKHPQYRDLVAA